MDKHVSGKKLTWGSVCGSFPGPPTSGQLVNIPCTQTLERTRYATIQLGSTDKPKATIEWMEVTFFNKGTSACTYTNTHTQIN